MADTGNVGGTRNDAFGRLYAEHAQALFAFLRYRRATVRRFPSKAAWLASRGGARATVAPQRADRQRDDSIVQLVRTWSGVEHHTAGEPLSQPLAQPREVSHCAEVGRSRLHLEGHQLSGSELREEVHLVASVFLSQVVETGSRRAERQLRPDLGHDEALQYPAQQITVANASKRSRTTKGESTPTI
jgi:hypothetical protein